MCLFIHIYTHIYSYIFVACACVKINLCLSLLKDFWSNLETEWQNLAEEQNHPWLQVGMGN